MRNGIAALFIAGLAVAGALGGAGLASAQHGADDPAGHVRHGQGADDLIGHDRHGHGHGNDDGPNHH